VGAKSYQNQTHHLRSLVQSENPAPSADDYETRPPRGRAALQLFRECRVRSSLIQGGVMAVCINIATGQERRLAKATLGLAKVVWVLSCTAAFSVIVFLCYRYTRLENRSQTHGIVRRGSCLACLPSSILTTNPSRLYTLHIGSAIRPGTQHHHSLPPAVPPAAGRRLDG